MHCLSLWLRDVEMVRSDGVCFQTHTNVWQYFDFSGYISSSHWMKIHFYGETVALLETCNLCALKYSLQSSLLLFYARGTNVLNLNVFR